MQGAAIGDVFVSDAVMNHDRRIPLPSFDKYGLGHTKTLAVASMAADLGLKTGTVTSGKGLCFAHPPEPRDFGLNISSRMSLLAPAGNSLDYTDKDMEIMTQHSAAVKEMEAGAIAWVAQLYQVPLLCVK
eukprot:scaffold130670_cov21-Tisochrysis_lutea.AAC.1